MTAYILNAQWWYHPPLMKFQDINEMKFVISDRLRINWSIKVGAAKRFISVSSFSEYCSNTHTDNTTIKPYKHLKPCMCNWNRQFYETEILKPPLKELFIYLLQKITVKLKTLKGRNLFTNLTDISSVNLSRQERWNLRMEISICIQINRVFLEKMSNFSELQTQWMKKV